MSKKKPSKKECLESIKNLQVETRIAERFYREEAEKEIRHYREQIDHFKNILKTTYNMEVV